MRLNSVCLTNRHPIRYDQLTVLDQIVATDKIRLRLEVQTENTYGWRNLGFTELGSEDAWAGSLRRGAQQLEDLHIKAGDAHYEAKLFPAFHPYGTGSLRSEFNSGGHQKVVRCRGLALEKCFRRSSLWCFFQLDLHIKTTMFFGQLRKRRCGRTMPATTDKFTYCFGNIVPSQIPDSTAWWRRQGKELAAICDECECGLMQAMVTITSSFGRRAFDSRLVFKCN